MRLLLFHSNVFQDGPGQQEAKGKLAMVLEQEDENMSGQCIFETSVASELLLERKNNIERVGMCALHLLARI